MNQRIAALRERFLPQPFDPTGQYPPEKQDEFRAFRFLAHAEFEACIEQIAGDAAASSVAKWKADGIVRRPVVALLATYRLADLVNFWDAKTTSRVRSPRILAPIPGGAAAAVDLALKGYRDTVKNNHGIRRANILRLAQPLGLKVADLEGLATDWLVRVDSFGNLRGNTAHQAGAAVFLINPEDDAKVVESIAQGIAALDRLLVKLQR